MPDLIEYDIDKAKDILNVYGLNIANKSEAYSNTIPKGEIISQYIQMIFCLFLAFHLNQILLHLRMNHYFEY